MEGKATPGNWGGEHSHRLLNVTVARTSRNQYLQVLSPVLMIFENFSIFGLA